MKKKPDLLTSLTIFVSAFLLFQIQPLFAKFILPWFGGSQSVWTTCLLFFQAFLLAGYAYAHVATSRLPPRSQAVLHVVLLLAALAFLPIIPDPRWIPGQGQAPTWRILALLARYLGLPYLMLSATSPLLQKWSVLSRPEASPYRLYALSNAGSLLALATFPFVFEPAMSRQAQARFWQWGFGLFVLASILNGWRSWRRPPVAVVPPPKKTKAPRAEDIVLPPKVLSKVLWFVLPACGSTLLLAITNKLCQDVASVPFLWVLPLSFYLLTFILCFDRPGWYKRGWSTLLLVPLLGLLVIILFQELRIHWPWQAAAYLGVLFVGCLVCHGELSRLRPAPRYLTSFYLLLSAGGAAGGLFVAVVAPLAFRSYAELEWSLMLLAALVVYVHAREKTGWKVLGRPRPVWPLLLVGALALGTALAAHNRREARNTAYQSRNFYGVLRLVEIEKGTPFHALKLKHGSINHGLQFLKPARASTPTTYYDEKSGVGLALGYLARPGGRHVGVVGLGTGTLAAYGRPGDTFRFYEINPEVRRLAETKFTFLRSSNARVEVILGDGRLSLEREPPQEFDLIVLDAFSSDAIPVHLLTREAFSVYLGHLKTKGLVAVHISNRHLNLFPVVLGASLNFRLAMTYIDRPEDPKQPWFLSSKWILLGRDTDFLKWEPIRAAVSVAPPNSADPVFWTDDHTSLAKIMKW
jgi:spermidine synthase